MTIRDAKGSRAAKAKGRQFENDVKDVYLRHGFKHVERRRLTGHHDMGDITGIPNLTVECKNHSKMALSDWIDQTIDEANAAGTENFVLHHKRRGHDAMNSYVSMPMWMWIRYAQLLKSVFEKDPS